MVNCPCATRLEGLHLLEVLSWSGDFFGGWIFALPCAALNWPRRGVNFGAVRLSMLVLGTLIADARRVRHVCYLANGPLLERLCGLSWVAKSRMSLAV